MSREPWLLAGHCVGLVVDELNRVISLAWLVTLDARELNAQYNGFADERPNPADRHVQRTCW